MDDRTALIRDKYNGIEPDTETLAADMARLASGEPLAYVIGWVPFLGLKIYLDSHPLIPRPETEWWTNELIAHLREKFADKPFTFLDLCAGSGAIGIAVLKAFPEARVVFAELISEHCALIRKNCIENAADPDRVMIVESDLFLELDMRFDVIASNPPYIPDTRTLDASVTEYEPSEALFAGSDGLSIIREIIHYAPSYLLPHGELWLECDISNAEEAKKLAEAVSAHSELRTDQYGRPRLVVSYWD